MASEAVEEIRYEVLSDRYNKLLRRKEVKMIIYHDLKGTPSRQAIRNLLAKLYNVPLEVVYVRKIATKYGIGRSEVEAHIYDDEKTALEIEPEYIIYRNRPELKKTEEGES